jgi:hypothetical protein
MTETEEIAWSQRKYVAIRHAFLYLPLSILVKRECATALTTRHQEVHKSDGPLLLPSADSRSLTVARVMSRLVTALEEQDHTMISGAAWPPRSHDLGRVMSEREAGEGRRLGDRYKPSGVALKEIGIE